MQVISAESLHEHFLNTYSAKGIMEIWSQEVEKNLNEKLLQLQQDAPKITPEVFIDRHREYNETYQHEKIEKDALTGALTRRELFKFFAITRALGYENVRVSAFDMNFLKDHNKQLGQPSGGDFALRVISLIGQDVAEETNSILIRFQSGGGDDFLLVQLPDENDKFKDVDNILKKKLREISIGDYFSGNIYGKEVSNYSTGKKIRLDPKLVDELVNLNSDLAQIIIPPSVTLTELDLNPKIDIETTTDVNGAEYYNFDILADKIEKSYSKIDLQKEQFLESLNLTNPSGSRKLQRKS